MTVIQEGTNETDVVCGESRGDWEGWTEGGDHRNTGVGVRMRGSLGNSTSALVLGAG